LLIIAYWIGPWLGVYFADWYLRRGRRVDGFLYDRSHNPVSGVVAMIVGMVVSVWLFSNQEGMTPDTVKKAAREVGQVTDFDAKYASLLDLVKSDIAFGKTLGVQATPTLFINGVKIAGVLAPQYLDQAIAIELKNAAK